MYKRNIQDPLKDEVEKALREYQNDICSPYGYAILRYAKQGLIDCEPSAPAQDFIQWYPLDPGYVILRMAARGILRYKPQGVVE